MGPHPGHGSLGEPLPLRTHSSPRTPEGGLGFVFLPPSSALSLLNLYQFQIAWSEPAMAGN